MSIKRSKSRLDALRTLLKQGTLRTQEDLREELESLGYKTTQSTISRDLRKLETIKTIDQNGNAIYRLSEKVIHPSKATSIIELVLDINTNGILVVIHTTPGSASLVARHLDQLRPGGTLGTIAGDDTVFVALTANQDSKIYLKEIEASLKKDI